MKNRFKTALDIQDASNPTAVVYELIAAINELRDEPTFEGKRHIERDPATRLIAYKLADLMNSFEINEHIDEYDLLRLQGERKAIGFEIDAMFPKHEVQE